MRSTPPKSNLRSFRYSDEVAAILEAQEGGSLNEKFENLVLYCYYKLDERKAALAAVNREIDESRERLYRLQDATKELRELEKDLQNAKFYFELVERRAKAISDTEK